MTPPCFGRRVWDLFQLDTITNFPGSFAACESCSEQELRLQFAFEAQATHASVIAAWSDLLLSLARPTTNAFFLDSVQRYQIIGTTNIGGMLIPVRFLKSDGSFTAPLLLVTGPPIPQFPDSPPLLSDDVASFSRSWQPANLPLPSACQPVFTTTWASSRDPNIDNYQTAFHTFGSAHLLFPKGTNLFRSLIMAGTDEHQTTSVPAFQVLRLDPTLDKTRFDNEDEKPISCVNPSQKPKSFWFGLASIPLPMNHNLPLGFLLDFNSIANSNDLVNALQLFTNNHGSATSYTWLNHPWIDAWIETLHNHSNTLALEALTFTQCQDTWNQFVASETPRLVRFPIQSTFPHMECSLLHMLFHDRLKSSTNTAKFRDDFTRFEELAQEVIRRPWIDPNTGEEFPQPLGDFPINRQPYLYLVVKPFSTDWITKYGIDSFRKQLRPPYFAAHFDPIILPDCFLDLSLSLRLIRVPSSMRLTPTSERPSTTTPIQQFHLGTMDLKDKSTDSSLHSSPSADQLVDRLMQLHPNSAQIYANREFHKPPYKQLFAYDSEQHDISLMSISAPTTASNGPGFRPTFQDGPDNPYVAEDPWLIPTPLQRLRLGFYNTEIHLSWKSFIPHFFDQDKTHHFIANNILQHNYVPRHLNLFAHLACYRLPTTAELYPVKRPYHQEHFHVDLLTLPGQFGADWREHVMSKKTPTLNTITFLVSKFKPWSYSIGLPIKPAFDNSFFQQHAVLKPLQTGEFNDGLKISTLQDMEYSFTPWQMLLSISAVVANQNKLPSDGLENIDMLHLIGNLIALFHTMTVDHHMYPDISKHFSVFILRAPLAAALGIALNTLQEPTIRSHWGYHRRLGNGAIITTAVMGSLCYLFREFLTWANLTPLSHHIYAASPSHQQQCHDITVLVPDVVISTSSAPQTINDRLLQWTAQFRDTFTSTDFGISDKFNQWYQVTLPSCLQS